MAQMTKTQKAVLDFFGVRYAENMDRVAASEIIEPIFDNPENRKAWAKHRDEDLAPPDPRHKQIFKFFKLQVPKEMTWRQAEDKCKELLSDKQIKKDYREWCKSLPPSKEQKEQLAFFGIDSKGLTTSDAADQIESCMNNPANQSAWEQHEDEKAAEEDLFVVINDDAADYDCKKISKSRFDAIIQHLRKKGYTAKSLDDSCDYDPVYAAAFELFPELCKDGGQQFQVADRSNSIPVGGIPVGQTTATFSASEYRRKAKSGCFGVLLVALILLSSLTILIL